MILNRLPMTKAVKAAIADGLGPNFPVGLTFAPRVDGPVGTVRPVVDAPYVVLIPLGGTTSGPPFAAPDADAAWTYQITLVAGAGDQLEFMQDRVQQVMLGRDDDGKFLTDLTVDGMSVMNRAALPGGDAEPLGGDQGALTVSTSLRYSLDVTPSPVPLP